VGIGVFHLKMKGAEATGLHIICYRNRRFTYVKSYNPFERALWEEGIS